ncbi:MAG TPA: DUF1697 domain-containing protein [Xanthobacteraceae bacterium]|nr:DUF1697 domain-containing protein [Xanthobacteraceae bacterium]
MTTYVALLRAVNVGGTGKLSMATLKALCGDAGFTRVETYIASGNVVLDSRARPTRVKAALEARLYAHFGKAAGVIVRTAAEMMAVREANPFAEAEPNRTYAFFLDVAPPRDALNYVKGRSDETIALGKREIFVHYPSGMGRSKLRIPAAAAGTARNMNTVAKLAEIAAKR